MASKLEPKIGQHKKPVQSQVLKSNSAVQPKPGPKSRTNNFRIPNPPTLDLKQSKSIIHLPSDRVKSNHSSGLEKKIVPTIPNHTIVPTQVSAINPVKPVLKLKPTSQLLKNENPPKLQPSRQNTGKIQKTRSKSPTDTWQSRAVKVSALYSLAQMSEMKKQTKSSFVHTGSYDHLVRGLKGPPLTNLGAPNWAWA